MLKDYLKKYQQFLVYSFIGLSGATLDVLIYAFLTETLDLHKVGSNTLSTSIGIINNFVLNVFFNFKVKDRLLKRFVSFYMVGLSGLLLSNLIIFVFVDWLNLNNLAVKVVSIIFVVILQYNLNKRVSFKKHE